MKKSNFIWITTTKEFMHCYPDAPKEVKFLRNLHRHLFHFKVYIQVKGNNRDVEFFMFKKEINKHLDVLQFNLYKTSCETLCDYIYDYIQEEYPNRDVKIEVSEDGENGAIKEY